MKIIVLMGGTSPEREVSLRSGMAINEACNKAGYNSEMLDLEKDIHEITDELKSCDLVFNALHGGTGENGIIQGYLDSIGVNYTGSKTLSSAICMDKDISKKLVQLGGYDTADWVCVHGEVSDKSSYLDEFPIVVKPNDLGSTIGLAIVQKEAGVNDAVARALDFSNNIMMEKYIAGRELTVAVLGDTVLPIVEIKPEHDLYDYACKYTKGLSNYICPADLPDNLTADIQLAALEIFDLLRCSDYARIDFRLDDNDRFWFLESNTLPGMTSTSLVPKAAKAAGIDFTDLIKQIINLSAK